MPREYKYFTAAEAEGLDEEYVSRLDLATEKTAELNPTGLRIPFIITSGYRSPEKNQSVVGAVPDSSHCKGLGTDLLVKNSHEVWIIVAALTAVGINRIGIYVNKDWVPVHIHNDMDPDKPPYVLFIKQEANA